MNQRVQQEEKRGLVLKKQRQEGEKELYGASVGGIGNVKLSAGAGGRRKVRVLSTEECVCQYQGWRARGSRMTIGWSSPELAVVGS